MVSGKKKTRILRRVYVRTPGGDTKLHYEKRNMTKRKCVLCGVELHGIPRMTKSRFSRLPKTKKRPERPYGGILCSNCMRKKLIENFSGKSLIKHSEKEK